MDAFVSRIDTTASSTVSLGHYSTYLGGAANDFGTSIAADSQGNSYVAGETSSGNFPKANPIQANINGASDAFITKLGPTLTLAVTETVSPTTVGVGNNVTFTYTITNNGDLTTGIIFTDVVAVHCDFCLGRQHQRWQLSSSRKQRSDLHGRNVERWTDWNDHSRAGPDIACSSVPAGFRKRWR